jgi:hypothetical protein
MALVFHVDEIMKGTHHFVDPSYGDAAERPCWFRLRWGAPLLASVNPFSSRFLRYDATGVIEVDGLTDGQADCTGSLELDYFGDKKITYDLCFTARGMSFRYLGEKTHVDLRHPLLLIKTHTTCYGAITDPGDHFVSKSVLHFDLRRMVEFARSIRLQRS